MRKVKIMRKNFYYINDKQLKYNAQSSVGVF